MSPEKPPSPGPKCQTVCCNPHNRPHVIESPYEPKETACFRQLLLLTDYSRRLLVSERNFLPEHRSQFAVSTCGNFSPLRGPMITALLLRDFNLTAWV
jgi:hypothetical protein